MAVGDFGRRFLALDGDRPQQHPARKAVGEAVENVADHRPGGRGDDADDLGQVGHGLFAVVVEQALGGQGLAPVLEQLEQGAFAGRFYVVDDDLVLRAPRIGGQPAAADDFEAVLGGMAQAGGDAAPAHRLDHRVLVLEAEIEMARTRPGEARDLAAHPDPLERSLDGALHRLGQFADRVLGNIAGGFYGLIGHGRGL